MDIFLLIAVVISLIIIKTTFNGCTQRFIRIEDDINQIKKHLGLLPKEEKKEAPKPVAKPIAKSAVVPTDEEPSSSAPYRRDRKRPLTPTAHQAAVEATPAPTPVKATAAKVTKASVSKKVSEPVPTPAPTPTPAPKKAEPTTKSSISFFENYFAGNIIGLIGTIAVIVGVIFLGVYAALSIGPLGRFMLVCSFSVLFYVAYWLLSKTKEWFNLSLWLRSASGITFLVACLASTWFPSMMWVTSVEMGWGLVCAGIAVNLIFGLMNKGQIFASIHVLSSLLALVFLPATFAFFVIATLIVIIGTLAALREKQWDKHLIVINLAYFGVHYYWWFKSNMVWPQSNLIPLLLCFSVGFIGFLSHYRSIYQKTNSITFSMFAHITILSTLGINLLMHSTGSILSTILLVVSSILVFALSTYALRKNIKWLFICDRVASLVLAICAVISFKKFNIQPIEIAFIVPLVSLLFTYATSHAKEKVTFNFGCIVTFVSYLYALIFMYETTDSTPEHFAILAASFIALALFLPFLEKAANNLKFGLSLDSDNDKYSTLLSFVLAAHIALGFIKDFQYAGIYMQYITLVPTIMLAYMLVFRTFHKNTITNAATAVGLCAGFINYSFNILLLERSKQIISSIPIDTSALVQQNILMASMLAIGLLAFILSYNANEKKYKPAFGIMYLWGAAMIASYIYIKSDTIYVGMFWLLITLAGSIIKDIKLFPKKEGEANPLLVPVTVFSMIGFGCFLLRLFFVDGYYATYIFQDFQTRYLSEILSIMVLIAWMISATKESNKPIQGFASSLLDFAMVLTAIYVVKEMRAVNQMMAFASIGIAGVALSNFLKTHPRIKTYSYFYYFLATLYLIHFASNGQTPTVHNISITWLKGLITTGLLTAFVIAAMSKKSEALLKGNNIGSVIERNQQVALIYPLMAAIAMFCYWSFSYQLLSLMFMIQCFALFLLSIVFKKHQFRIISMIGVAIVCLRLVFYDLQNSDVLAKAVVFIAVGIILIVMNSIYNKYKHRFEK